MPPKARKPKWYVGYKHGVKLEAFTSCETPTMHSHGKYFATIGPFHTKRATLWTEKYGHNNPHFQHVADAERLSLEA